MDLAARRDTRDFKAPVTRAAAILCALCMVATVVMLLIHQSYDDSYSLWFAMVTATFAALSGGIAWLSFVMIMSRLSSAIDHVIERMDDGPEGGYDTEKSSAIQNTLPRLGKALDGLLEQTLDRINHELSRATIDSVTALPNRLHFRELVENALTKDDHGALLFIDLDRFKLVNDRLGHAAGDRTLAEIADRLIFTAHDERGAGQTAPIVGRLAGDEFTIFVPGVRGSEIAAKIGDHVLTALRPPVDIGGQKIVVGASVGIALAPTHGASLTELMKSADIAMYHAKSKGRGQCQLFTKALAAKAADRRRLEKGLRSGLEQREFSLAYQPQIDLTTGDVIAVEALLRWIEPTSGIRKPSEFFDIAEDSGLIVEIGEWVTENAAATMAEWMESGFNRRLMINISQRQLEQPYLLRQLANALDRYRIPYDNVGIEIDEASAMRCDEEVIAELTAMRGKGMVVAIDNFGTSSSNLNRLQRLPVDWVKLDRIMIRDIATDEGARAILASVIGLIHGIGFTSMAEGVETEEQLDLLRAMGCAGAQGYAICEPVSAEALIAWSASTKARKAG